MKIYSISVFIILNIFLKNSTCENLKLLILHNNDMHSRFEETSRTSGTCKDKANCYGGFARVLHVIREARKAAADGTGPPVLYLNAGDTYTGTSWFSVHKWKIAADFMNLLHPDVATLGNHDFDYGTAGLLPFLNAANFPIVVANLDFSNEPQLLATNVTKSYVIENSGMKIGVIGYLTGDTVEQSNPEKVIFSNEIDSVREESERLDKEGVKIIVALGHSGYEIDQKVAEEVPLVDLVIGGHTNTFLCTGPQPDLEKPEGPYPTVVTQASGKKVPVVQAYGLTKYMGRLTVVFDEAGELLEFSGEAQLLNNTIPQDEEALNLLEKFRPEMDALDTEVLGQTLVYLHGNMTHCRLRECNFANFITDALVAYHLHDYKGQYWTDTPIALTNAGVIRSGIARKHDGSITKSDILGAIPFEQAIYTMELTGDDLLKTLEIGVRGTGDASSGEFIHPSGIFYTYDRSKPIGSRIIDVKVRCGSCSVPSFESLTHNKTYKIVTIGFLAKGGDGHHVIKKKGFNHTLKDKGMWDVIFWYLKKMTPIYPQEEGRITCLEPISNKGITVNAPAIFITSSVIILWLLK